MCLKDKDIEGTLIFQTGLMGRRKQNLKKGLVNGNEINNFVTMKKPV